MPAPVRLTRLRAEDAPAIAAAMSDRAVSRWLSTVPHPYGLAEAQAFIAGAGPGERAIRAGDSFAGMVRVTGDLGYWVAPGLQRQGIGRRAAMLALSRRFDDPDCEAVETTVIDGNAASLALLAGLGFEVMEALTVPSLSLGPQPGKRLRVTRAGFAAAAPLCLQGGGWDAVPIDEAARAALFPLATAPQAARMLLRFNENMAQGEFDALHPDWAARRPVRLALRSGGRIAGSIGLGAGPCPPVFYYLAPEAQGRGVASAALIALAEEAFARWEVTALRAEVMADNPASMRVLEKAGFQRVEATELHSAGRDSPAPGWLYQRNAP